MSLPPCETEKPTFSPEQRRALGMLYNFLIDLGWKRLRRLEQQSTHGEGSKSTGSANSHTVEARHDDSLVV
jgi:hypothetical protein